MNKKDIKEQVKTRLELNDKSLEIFMNIIDDIPVIGKNNKDKMINEFITQMNVDNETAEHYYEVFSEIITTALKDKIKHPFKNLDK